MTSAVTERPQTAADVLGSTLPRLYSPPLIKGDPGPCGCGCALTRLTSYGFAVIDFARDVLEEPLDPWQAWLVVHAGELLPDGRPRFRRVLVLVARQNGKTHLLKVLALYWMFVEAVRLIVGMSTNLDYARESWLKAVEDIRSNEALIELMPRGRSQPGELPRPGGIREANGQESIVTLDKSRYKIAASNNKGGRSLSIGRLISDELREQRDWKAYNASYPAMNAQLHGQAFFISNAGDDGSVVLISLRKGALSKKDRRLGLFEWSAPEGCDIEDITAIAAANPNLGRRLDVDSLIGAAALAKENGGEEEAGYRTEVLCMHVKKLDAAVDPARWKASETAIPEEGFLGSARRRIALCVDISPDGLHATLAAAAVIRPGVTRVEVVAAWHGIGATAMLRAELPVWLTKIKPRRLGWFPTGPAATLAADLGKTRKPPRGVKVEEIKMELAAVCMGFAEQVKSNAIEQPADPLLDAHVLNAERLRRDGGTWVFSRKGEGHCDGAYAAAGAVHLARTLPPAPSTSVPVSSAVRDELARQRAAKAASAPPAE